jgi:hypothetical protein
MVLESSSYSETSLTPHPNSTLHDHRSSPLKSGFSESERFIPKAKESVRPNAVVAMAGGRYTGGGTGTLPPSPLLSLSLSASTGSGITDAGHCHGVTE